MGVEGVGKHTGAAVPRTAGDSQKATQQAWAAWSPPPPPHPAQSTTQPLTLDQRGGAACQRGQQAVWLGGRQAGQDAAHNTNGVGVQLSQARPRQQRQQALQHLWQDIVALPRQQRGGAGQRDGQQLEHGGHLFGLACSGWVQGGCRRRVGSGKQQWWVGVHGCRLSGRS